MIRIRIQHFRLNTDPDPGVLMTKNYKKNLQLKKIKFFGSKILFTYPWASIKDVQVTKEAFNSQKRTSRTSKHEISEFFLLLRVIFALLGSDPDSEYGSGSTDPIEPNQFGSVSATLILNDLYLGIVLLPYTFAKKSPMSVGWPPCLHKFANLQGY